MKPGRIAAIGFAVGAGAFLSSAFWTLNMDFRAGNLIAFVATLTVAFLLAFIHEQ